MSRRPHFIGDEAGAAGYRLAGFETHACDPGDAGRTLERLLDDGDASLVLVASPHAERVDAGRLRAIIRDCDPPVAVVGDAAGTEEPPDLSRRVRAMLGVAT